MIAQILTVIAPVFTIVALGYLWARLRQTFDSETMTNLVVKVATPCLVFTTLTGLNLQLELIGQMALAASLGLTLSAAVGMVVLKFLDLPYNTYLASLMHPNSGNIGLPLVFMAFGDEGLALGVAYFTVISISQYTLGYGIASGSVSVTRFLKQPLLYAVIISLGVLSLDLPVPIWIAKTTELMSGIVIPALLMVLGFSLARLKIADLRIALCIAIARILMGISIGLLLVKWLNLEGSQAGVVFLMSTMPIAVFNFVFAKHFNRSPETVAGVIVTSTLLVFTLLPGFVWIAIHLADNKPILGFQL